MDQYYYGELNAMKILILGPISTAGIAPYLYELPPPEFPAGSGGAPLMNTLIGELLAQGHEVVAITCGGFWVRQNTFPVSLKGERFEFHCVPVRRHSMRPRYGHIGRILDMYSYERRLMRKVLFKINPDVIHAHWTYEYAMVAIDSGLPYLVTAHDDPVGVLKLFRNVYRLIRFFMAQKVLNQATAITAVSENLRDRLQPFANHPIDVVANPLARKFTQALTKARLAPSNLTEIRLICVINGWSEFKNPKAALNAFSIIYKSLPNVSLHLFGHDFQVGGIAQQWAKNRGISDGVVFHGPVSQEVLLEELKLATLMLHPGRLESCPMGIAEAMALGLPVVGGNNSGGVAWMIGGGGLVVDINKPKEIAIASLSLITDDNLYLKCSSEAIERIKNFKPEIIVGQYEMLYQRAIENFKVKKSFPI